MSNNNFLILQMYEVFFIQKDPVYLRQNVICGGVIMVMKQCTCEYECRCMINLGKRTRERKSLREDWMATTEMARLCERQYENTITELFCILGSSECARAGRLGSPGSMGTKGDKNRCPIIRIWNLVVSWDPEVQGGP